MAEQGGSRGWLNAEGYRIIRCAGHAVAASNGSALEHRVVLFDALGEGPHACHWCGRPLNWLKGSAAGLQVDHVDGDRQNNSLENLVPACIGCNSRRSWKSRHLKVFAPVLIDAVEQQVPDADKVKAIIRVALRTIAHAMHSNGPMSRSRVLPVDLAHLAMFRWRSGRQPGRMKETNMVDINSLNDQEALDVATRNVWGGLSSAAQADIEANMSQTERAEVKSAIGRAKKVTGR
jgi:hypothetical protein